jgi:hypothetical protein
VPALPVPVYYNPERLPRSNAYAPDVAGWGARGGLRLAAFVDEFGDNGRKFSICESSFADALGKFGEALAGKLYMK